MTLSLEKRKQLAMIFGAIATILPFISGSFLTPQAPHLSEMTTKIVLGTILMLTVIATALRQFYSVSVDNNALNITWIVLAVTIIGGVCDFIGVLPISENTSTWLKFILTLVVTILNALSKVLWPSP